jgi:hypothetical protein
MINTLEAVDRSNIGFQADMAHTLPYLLGYNSPEHRILPRDFDWNDRETLTEGQRMVDAIAKAGVKNTVWYNYRRVPAITLAKNLIYSGKFIPTNSLISTSHPYNC